MPERWRRTAPVVPVVRLAGVIGFSTPLRPGLTLAGCARALERAFGMKRAKAVALLINSPGGSAVQSHLIFQRIRQLAEEKNLQVLAFIEDAGASGGYMIACAGDEIICDASSIVGSIGVVGAGFGLHQAIQRLGIERRIYTAGENKAILDPFQPEKPQDVALLKAIQQDIHAGFIALVKARRGSRLAGPENTIFSGEFWVGRTALGYGIVDRLGDLRSTLRERFGEKVIMPLIGGERGLLGRLRPLGLRHDLREGQAASLAEDVVSTIEARAIWARIGL
ncbi:MAG: S49 family peptidase [Proteobacteria bacterium]|nr:S49 family peptidase [Pseudomonadota bacterium]